MSDLLLAVGIFLAAHMIPAIRPVRAGLVRAMGEAAYLVGYSVVSLAVIVWMVRAYSAAPYVELWPAMEWARWLAVGVMAPACVLIVAGMASPNPFSLGWGRKGFDPARPGIVGVSRHPAIWGLGLWAGPLSLDAKRRRVLGVEAFGQLKADVARTAVSTALVQAGPWRIGGGLALWAGLLSVHEWAFGVAPVVW